MNWRFWQTEPEQTEPEPTAMQRAMAAVPILTDPQLRELSDAVTEERIMRVVTKIRPKLATPAAVLHVGAADKPAAPLAAALPPIGDPDLDATVRRYRALRERAEKMTDAGELDEANAADADADRLRAEYRNRFIDLDELSKVHA